MQHLEKDGAKQKAVDIEVALEHNNSCKAKDLLSGMTFDEISKALNEVSAMNNAKRQEGQKLPHLSVTETKNGAEREIDVYSSSISPYKNMLVVKENPVTKKIAFETNNKCYR